MENLTITMLMVVIASIIATKLYMAHVNPPPTVPTSASLVFGTAELLEIIICQLEPTEQVRAREVCKTWWNVVQTSVPIQASAFPFDKPIAATEYLEWKSRKDVRRRVVDGDREQWLPRLSNERSPSTMRIGRLNPIFRERDDKTWQTSTDFDVDISKVLAWQSDFWRNQLIFQPPVNISEFTIRHESIHGSGTTLGELYDAIAGAYSRDRASTKYPEIRLTICNFLTEDNPHVAVARRVKAEEEAEALEATGMEVTEMEAAEMQAA